MKVLVTGGAGFIGSNLALSLEKTGYEVVVSDNFLSGAKHNLTEFKGDLIKWDCADSKIPTSILNQKFNYIFHQAAITDPRYPNPKETFLKNVEGFNQVLRLRKETGAKLIYASTAGLYGNGPVPMKEDQPKECITVYGQSKLRMDETASSFFKEFHIVGLRYFNVFGPGEAHKGGPASMIYHLYHQMKKKQRPRIFFKGEHQRDFIYIKDVIHANICAMSSPSGVYNVGTGKGTSFNELVHILNEVMNLKLEPEYFDMPFDPKTYQHHTVADTTLACDKLKFKAAYTFKEAVKEYISYLEKETT